MHHRESRCSDREGATHLDALKLDTRLVQELYHCARLAVARADTPTLWTPQLDGHPIETPHRDTPAPGEPMTARVHAHAPCSDTHDSTQSYPQADMNMNMLGTIWDTSSGPY